MPNIVKPPILDETGQDIVAAINEHALSMTDRTGTRIAVALEALAGQALTTSDVVDNLYSTDSQAALSANQGRLLRQLIQDNMYPVGSLYTTVNATNPQTYFSGEWINVTAQFPYVAETYTSGTNWYRWWSDGWLEQGGRLVGALTSAAYGTVNLLKEYKNTNYHVLCQEGESATFENTGGDTAGYGENMGITDATIRSFRYSITGSRHFNWRAAGYAEIPTLTKYIWKRVA